MKHLAAVLCALAAMPAWGQAPPQGYAFDEPHLLARQLLWGVVHGVRLLGRACFEQGNLPAAMAYAEWADRQKPAILAAERDLARHYFDRDTASPEALAAALNLRPSLEAPPDGLGPACETLPAALDGARYDLERLRAEHLKAMLQAHPQSAIWVDR